MEPNPVPPTPPDLAPPNAAPAVADAPPAGGLIERVRSVTPVVERLIGKVKAVGVVSAVAAAVLWVILFHGLVWPLTVRTLVGALALVVLLLPAAGTFVAVLTLREVLDLPNRLRNLPSTLRTTVGEISGEAASVAAPKRDRSRSARALGFFGVLWKLRGIVEDTRGSWLRTIALARFAKLASLPFFLWLLGAFALNFVVIAAAVLAVLITAVF